MDKTKAYILADRIADTFITECENREQITTKQIRGLIFNIVMQECYKES